MFLLDYPGYSLLVEAAADSGVRVLGGLDVAGASMASRLRG
jgi:hypothetical protein